MVRTAWVIDVYLEDFNACTTGLGTGVAFGADDCITSFCALAPSGSTCSWKRIFRTSNGWQVERVIAADKPPATICCSCSRVLCVRRGLTAAVVVDEGVAVAAAAPALLVVILIAVSLPVRPYRCQWIDSVWSTVDVWALVSVCECLFTGIRADFTFITAAESSMAFL